MSVFDKAKIDLELAEKLRKEVPTQYTVMVKMHLSFLLEISNETNEPEHVDKIKGKKSWLFPKRKAGICAGIAKNSPDAPILTEELIAQIINLMEFLEKDENLRQEGIFRKTGSVSRQQELKFLVNQLKPLKLEEFTCHDVASVMKSILADLPEPLLTEAYFPAYSQVADICNSKENDEHSRIKNSLQLLCLLLPQENRKILMKLITLLHKASLLEPHNKMTSDTLATLFTPHLICPRKLQPEVLHQTAATMTRMISFMIQAGTDIFLVPEKLSTDIRAYFAELKRRRETPEKILDNNWNDSISDSVANTVFTFVDREKTAEAHMSNTTDTALAQLYAHIQSLPESSKKKKLIKQFNKQNGQGTPLQFLHREKSSSACRSIGDSIKKHIFHKALHKTPKRDSHNTPSSSSVSSRTPLTLQTHPNKRILFQSPICETISSPVELKPPTTPSTSEIVKPVEEVKIDDTPAIARPNILNNHAELAQEEMIDDEDFRSSDEEEIEETPPQIATTPTKSFKSRLMKGVSLGNLKFPFHSAASPKTSPKMKKSKSSSILIDLEKDDEKRKQLMKSVTESFDSEESDLFYSMCDATKEHWHVDVSNINYFLNQTGMQEHPAVRNSMSPITKSTQRMPKSMQESIMTPRSRKPVMLAIFGNSDPKSYQNNISELLEDSAGETEAMTPTSSGEIPLNSMQVNNLRSKSENDISSANDNGLPVVDMVVSNGSNSSSTPDSLTSAFKDYIYSRQGMVCNPDDESFSSQPDDFESSNEYQKLESSNSSTSLDKTQEIEKIINQSNMSESLLHCLDGNSDSPSRSRKRHLESESSSESESLKRPLIENDFTDL